VIENYEVVPLLVINLFAIAVGINMRLWISLEEKR